MVNKMTYIDKATRRKRTIKNIADVDYFWNGACLQAINKNSYRVLGVIAKKYYNDILFSEHRAVRCSCDLGGLIKVNPNGKYILIVTTKTGTQNEQV